MNYFLSAAAGAVVAVMISINGVLSNAVGIQEAAIIFCLISLIVSLIISIGKQSASKEKLPLWMYSAGIFNALTIWFNNLAFGKITVSAILAISLLGQAVVSAVVDHYGFFGIEKQRFDTFKLVGFIIVSLGLLVLTFPVEGDALFAVVITLLTGFCVVLSRFLNAEVAKKRSLQVSVAWNFFVASLSMIVISLAFYRTDIPAVLRMVPRIDPLLLSGALFAVASILITNYVSPRIASYYLTLFLFIGQIFTGLILDIILDGVFSIRNFSGGVIVLIGLIFNLYCDKVGKNKQLA